MTLVMARELDRYGVTVNAISPRARTRMTENLFGDMAKAEEGKFDSYAPENVAPPVALFASDEAADVNGQNFVVYGGSVWVMQGWQPAGELKRDSGWTPKELADNKSKLFGHVLLEPAAVHLLTLLPRGDALPEGPAPSDVGDHDRVQSHAPDAVTGVAGGGPGGP